MCSSMSGSKSSPWRSWPHCMRWAYSMQCGADLWKKLVSSFTIFCIAMQVSLCHDAGTFVINFWISFLNQAHTVTSFCTYKIDVRPAFMCSSAKIEILCQCHLVAHWNQHVNWHKIPHVAEGILVKKYNDLFVIRQDNPRKARSKLEMMSLVSKKGTSQFWYPIIFDSDLNTTFWRWRLWKMSVLCQTKFGYDLTNDFNRLHNSIRTT